MEGQDSKEERIKRLEKEIKELREGIEAGSRKEEILLNRLKEYESAFYKELNAQLQVYKQSWTWRIGRLFVRPADFIFKLFNSKKKTITDRTTKLKNPLSVESGDKAVKIGESFIFNFENQVSDETKINIAVIFDTFTQSCFKPEFNTICFTPENWKEVLESIPVQGLFIESAWQGIGDSWTDKIVNLSGNDQSEVVKIIEWAKNHKIPTVFWNKEDPIHFEQFIEVAKRFDFIFTTDAGCIPAYQDQASKAVVNSLPFAAQPKLHNPVAEAERTKSVCFAGSYYGHRYHERQTDMDFLLKPSLDYGLEIFDRHYGDTGNTAKNFIFPDIYQKAIIGKLDYHEMIKSYKKYKVFLNVNSVKYSTTMFARRVFELLASGTPVISTYSQGIINILGEGTVFISESESDTKKHLEYLLENDQNWWKASLNGMRKVMEQHTYEERTRYIFDIIGLENPIVKPVKFSVVSRISTMDDISYIEKLLRLQSYESFDVVLILSAEAIKPDDHLNEIISLFSPFPVRLIKEDSESLETDLLGASDSDYIAFFHMGKYYGPNYLNDFSIAVKYANPKIMGKKSVFRLLPGDKFLLSDKGSEYHYVTRISNATSVHRKADLNSDHLREFLQEGSVIDMGSGILSIDPYNYLDLELPIKKEIFLNPKLKEINL